MDQSAWTDSELESAVEAYRRMQWLEEAGHAPRKSVIRNYYLSGPLEGRSKGSFEYRMQNISAVLDAAGRPSLSNKGYQPLNHVGGQTSDRLTRLLDDADSKLYVARQICRRLGIDPLIADWFHRKGSTIERDFFRGLCKELDLPSAADTVPSARSIAVSEGVPWNDGCWSGGSTITQTGLERIHSAIECFVGAKEQIEFYSQRLPDSPDSPVPEPVAEIREIEQGNVEQCRYERPLREVLCQRRENVLVTAYRDFLQEKGVHAGVKALPSPVGGKTPCDIWVEERRHLIEAKFTTDDGTDDRNKLRMALGQLIDYGRLIDDVQATAVLLPRRPAKFFLELISAGDASCIWQTDTGFEDNAEGAFC